MHRMRLGRSPLQRSPSLSASFYILQIVRSLHLRLLSMHVASTLSQTAGVAKYLLPVSDASCTVTHRMMLGMLSIFDVSELFDVSESVIHRVSRVVRLLSMVYTSCG